MNIEELKRHFTHEVSHWGIFRDHTESQRKVEIAKGVLALLARLEAAQRLRDASRTLHEYLVAGDDEGLIAHAPQMAALWEALAAFDKEQS